MVLDNRLGLARRGPRIRLTVEIGVDGAGDRVGEFRALCGIVQTALITGTADETHFEENRRHIGGQQHEIAGIAMRARQEIDPVADPVDQQSGEKG